MEKLTTKDIREQLTMISSDEMNQNHFNKMNLSSEIAIISTDTEWYKRFEEWRNYNNAGDQLPLYLTGEHKELILNTMIKHFDTKIEEKRQIIKNGL